MAPYTHPTFRHWEEFLSHARDGYSRPVANNTRVHWQGEDAIAIRLHSTDVVTITRDGRYRLSTGGWFTITTLDRIRSYSPACIVTNGGDWALRGPDIATDPEPERLERTIPKPYKIADPGPEPIDNGEGCVAGTREEFIAHELDYVSEYVPREKPWDFITARYFSDGSGPARFVHRAYVTGNVYGTTPHNYAWECSYASERLEDVPTGWTYKQCPHCAAFQARHERWRQMTYGDRYPRGLRGERGFEQMTEMLERFGSREAWQAAYIEEFRAVRQNRVELKAWHRRNYVPWHSGIECDWEGRATLAEARKWRRELKLIEQEERRRARVHARVERERKRIEAKRAKKAAREAAVKRQVAEALANSLIAELEITRRESFV
jgi:hypothetical protein